MHYLKVNGGIPLEGEVETPGAKNAITKLLVASLISDQPCTFNNVPNIGDVEVTVSLCKEVGMQVDWDKQKKQIKVITKKLRTEFIPQRFSGANRIPILLIGALLGRTSEDIIVPTVGGCQIGKRAVNFHIEALEKLGAKIEYRHMKREGAYFAHAHEGLKGAIITLPYPSIGATENTLLAAVRAKGNTTIHNAAIEPEIIDLILFLQKLGAHISMDGDRTIHIQGTEVFYPVEHSVIPDRIVAASLGIAALATKGRVFVKGARHEHMITFLNYIRQIGGGISISADGIEFYYTKQCQGGIHIETGVHPGFMTDWQQPFALLLTQTKGMSVIHETVYENRFGYIETLKEMGADVELFTHCLGSKACRFSQHNYKHSLVVRGPTPLKGKEITIPDLRAGFAYVLAALITPDTTLIKGLHFLDRGYEEIDLKLKQLGANIERIKHLKDFVTQERKNTKKPKAVKA